MSPHAFCITSQRVTLRSKVKAFSAEAVGKPSLNRANEVAWSRPETRRSIHGQVEAVVRHCGGPNPLMLKN